jgi:hypothetical protein
MRDADIQALRDGVAAASLPVRSARCCEPVDLPFNCNKDQRCYIRFFPALRRGADDGCRRNVRRLQTRGQSRRSSQCALGGQELARCGEPVIPPRYSTRPRARTMSNMRTFSIFRYDPDEQSAAQMQTYHIELRASDRTLLNVLERIKAEDNSLAYRRSCREGNLRLRRDEYQRKNGLACLTNKGAGGPDPAAAFARLAGDS